MVLGIKTKKINMIEFHSLTRMCFFILDANKPYIDIWDIDLRSWPLNKTFV